MIRIVKTDVGELYGKYKVTLLSKWIQIKFVENITPNYKISH
jgi:hypothetical protein